MYNAKIATISSPKQKVFLVWWGKIRWTLSTFRISLTPTTRFHGDKADKRLPRDEADLLHCRSIKLDGTLSGLGSHGWVSVSINHARFSVSGESRMGLNNQIFVNFPLDGDEDMCQKHWQIQGGAPRTRAPLRVQFLSFSCSFQQKLSQIIGWRWYARLENPRFATEKPQAGLVWLFGSKTTHCGYGIFSD